MSWVHRPCQSSPWRVSGHGDIECHLTGVKEPELMREVEHYLVAIVRLTAPGSKGIQPCS